MAIANALGSNVFDICEYHISAWPISFVVCATTVKLTFNQTCRTPPVLVLGLGLPWLLSNIYYGKRAEVSGDGLVENVIILAGTVVLFIFVLAVNKWRINTTVGIVLFALYFVFIVYAILRSVL